MSSDLSLSTAEVSANTQQQLLSLAAAAQEALVSRGKAKLRALLTQVLKSFDLGSIVEAHTLAVARNAMKLLDSGCADIHGAGGERPVMLAAVLGVCATHDWYVLPAHSVTLRHAMSSVAAQVGPAELGWVSGGHAMAHLGRSTQQLSRHQMGP